MLKKIKRLICFIGNYMPPPVNKYFYFLSGVKFENVRNTWIGANCYFDNYSPNLISIENGVCISFKVTIITHFDPTNSIKKPQIRKFSKPVKLKKNCFIGANSTLYPGVIVGERSIVSSGIVLNENVEDNLLLKKTVEYKKKKIKIKNK